MEKEPFILKSSCQFQSQKYKTHQNGCSSSFDSSTKKGYIIAARGITTKMANKAI